MTRSRARCVLTAAAEARRTAAAPKVLAVSDDDAYRGSLVLDMRSMGMEAEGAMDPEAARRLAACNFDTLVVDLAVGGRGFPQVVRDLRMVPELAAVPVVVMSDPVPHARDLAALAQSVRIMHAEEPQPA